MLDVLGDEMKAYEAETRISVPSDTIMVVRVDGRAFHTWTRGLTRPYDPRFNAAMDATALALAEAVSSCVAVYVQSDEISVIASDLASPATEHWFAGGVQKVASVAASAATASFNEAARELDRGPAMFDGRVFSLPSLDEAVRYLTWRHRDARRNAVSMLAQHHLGRRAIEGVGTRRRVEMLTEAGHNPDSEPAGFTDGRLAMRHTVSAPVEFTHKRTGERVVLPEVTRRVWQISPATVLRDSEAALALLTEAHTPPAAD